MEFWEENKPQALVDYNVILRLQPSSEVSNLNICPYFRNRSQADESR